MTGTGSSGTPETRQCAEANQRHVRNLVMLREPRLAQVLGEILLDRSEHIRDCQRRSPQPRRTRGRGSR